VEVEVEACVRNGVDWDIEAGGDYQHTCNGFEHIMPHMCDCGFSTQQQKLQQMVHGPERQLLTSYHRGLELRCERLRPGRRWLTVFSSQRELVQKIQEMPC